MESVYFINKSPLIDSKLAAGVKFEVEVAGFGWTTSPRRAASQALENTLADVALGRKLPDRVSQWISGFRQLEVDYSDFKMPGLRPRDFDYFLRLKTDPSEAPKLALIHLRGGRTFHVFLDEELTGASLPIYMLASIRERDKKFEWRQFF